MTADSQSCPQCGAPIAAGGRFCGGCGADLTTFAVDPSPTASATTPDPKKTSLGMPAVTASRPGGTPGTPAPDDPQRAPKRSNAKQTMLGMPAVAVGHPKTHSDVSGTPTPATTSSGAGGFAPVSAPSPRAPAAALPASPIQDGTAARQRDPAKQTMLGMTASSVAPSVKQVDPSKQTLLGMTRTEAPTATAAPPTTRAPQAPPPAVIGSAPTPSPSAEEPGAFHAHPRSGAQKLAPQSNRTMLGVMTPGLPPPAVAGQAAPPPRYDSPAAKTELTYAPDSDEGRVDVWASESLDSAPRAPVRRGPVVALVLLLVLVGAAVVGYLYFRGGAAEVNAQVVTVDGAEALQVDVLGAVPGTKVRFDGREEVTQAGRAVFALGENDLQMGDNRLHVEVVEPSGASTSSTVVLSLAYRVRPDLSGLADDEPSVRVVVDAFPGSSVTIDETPVHLDASGHGVHRLLLAGEAQRGSLERDFHYRVLTPGKPPADGVVRVRIPFALLRVERPGAQSITDRERVEIAGAAHSDAIVRVNGNVVPVREGRFLAEIEVPMGSSEHQVIAARGEQAPRRVTLQIRRVADLQAEAERYEVDEGLDYARLAASPNDYRGKRVAFVGRVYNVDVHDGRASLQIVVRDCARGRRCPLWVNYDGGVTVGLNEWVEVRGTVAGEQQYRAASSEVRSDPAIDAAFVVRRDVDALQPRPRR